LITFVWSWETTHQPNGLVVLCPGVAFAIMLALGSDDVLERAKQWIARRPLRAGFVPAALWLLYFVYAAGMGIFDVRPGILMAAYLSLPFLILWPRFLWLEPVAMLSLWLPLEFGVVRRILMKGPGADPHCVFAQVLAVDAGVVAFAVWNRIPGIGYRFEWRRNALAAGVIHFAMFAAIAIPLGLAIGFLRYAFVPANLLRIPLLFAGIFLFTALPEEFLFRGLIQNWFERATRHRTVALIAASVIFGASHLNNGPPIPNYKYFLMASIAGVFYGRAWRSTRSLMASSLTHSLVDTFWSVFFR
jgi:membrane protease YdiL (CAAX protease family)